MYKKYLKFFLACVFTALIFLILGTQSRKIILKVNHLENKLTELKIEQKDLHLFDYTYE